MISSTTGRVPKHTAARVNKSIREQTQKNVDRFASSRQSIDHRIQQLDEEWDIERTLEANAAIASLVGISLAAAFGRKWLALPAAVGGFLLQHAVQGWCPPLPVFRRLGFRTQTEIEQERMALKTLRGDFDGVTKGKDKGRKVRAEKALHAVEQ